MMNKPLVTFATSDKDAIIQKIQAFAEKEFGLELGQFEAGDLLSFFATEVGPFFYNQGLRDAQAVLRKRIDDIAEAMENLEKPVETRAARR
ncbi:MAG: DUF2164 domain-containing protein [Bacteroidetes bacterium]|nr:DUF2164 domain-containing protein [Bacteroidota bacterium]